MGDRQEAGVHGNLFEGLRFPQDVADMGRAVLGRTIIAVFTAPLVVLSGVLLVQEKVDELTKPRQLKSGALKGTLPPVDHIAE